MSAADEVLRTLSQQRPPALFFSELAARVPGTLDPVVAELEAAGAVLVLAHEAPDRHLEGLDLRVVAMAPDGDDAVAVEAAEAVWSRWLREFLGTHRCE